MSNDSSIIIAWEEGEMAQSLLAPEQPMSNVVASRLGQIFFLTEDGRVYLSTHKQDGLSGRLQELALPVQCVVSITCSFTHTIFVTDRGRVLMSELATPEKVEELTIKKQEISCPHGVLEDGEKLSVRDVASNNKIILLVADDGKLWILDESQSQLPKPLPAFNSSIPISISCGMKFSVVLIQNLASEKENHNHNGCDTPDGALLFMKSNANNTLLVGSCQDCREQYKSTLSLQKLNLLESFGDSGKDQTLAQVCWSKADHLVRQSAQLLNSDIAKQFITRQLSWVTGSNDSSDDNSGDVFTKVEGNVTQQVANRVAEGVRTLGDAASTVVNRMSRHWSGSGPSQEESIIPTPLPVSETPPTSFDSLSLPGGLILPAPSNSLPPSPRQHVRQFLGRHQGSRNKRLASSSLSLDSHIHPAVGNRQPSLEAASPNRLERIISAGRQLINTSVWTWGDGSQGHLGQSDCVSRSEPSLITHLQGVGVWKIACGMHHSLALLLDGRVLAWGANAKGQIGPGQDLSFVSTPLQVSLPFRATVCDIAAGMEHSLLLTTNGEVLFLGFSMATQKSTLMRLNLPVQSPSSSPATGNIKRIWAAGSLSCCLRSDGSCCNCWPHWTEFLLSEQLFLRQMLQVSRALFKHLSDSNATGACALSRRELFKRYENLMACSAFNVHLLLESAGNNSCSSHSIALVRWIDEFIRIYRSYGRAYSNALAVSALVPSKTELPVLEPLWPDLLQYSLASGKSSPLPSLMAEPIGRLREYVLHLEKLANSHPSDCFYRQAARKCQEASSALELECQSADITRSFWDSCSIKLADALRTPERRLIRESRSHPITLLHSGRFSSHWFIILTDVLVHVSGYSGHVAYPLQTIWVEPLQDLDGSPSRNGLLVTMPEETLTLTCPSSGDKMEWLTALQLAIKQSLKIDDSMIGSAGSGRSTPPLVRSASYTFTKMTGLKDVTYSGAWFCGKMQGEGELRWPDGRHYQGSFRQNVQFGYGRSESPGVGGSVYEGSWKDGKMCGYGVLKYANGDFYEGTFRDGQPSGHGTLKRGHFLTSAASLYVGQWEGGQKSGYGVMDDIVTGEKYMGMWLADAKHGQAVLVTIDGLYIEGSFTSNKMTGQCVMLLEDGTSYEGEVAGVGVLGGKGRLCLPNGDSIQGAFHGSFGDGVRINGTLTKALAPITSPSPVPPTQAQRPAKASGVSADRKWGAIYEQCCQTLGLSSQETWTAEDTIKAWDQLAVAISQTKHQRPPGSVESNGLLSSRSKLMHRRQGSSVSIKSISSEHHSMTPVEIPEIFQSIPDYGRSQQLDVEEFKKIETYLLKALESNYHPLGRMLAQLADVYRATYVGVGAHPRLLPHAVAEVHVFVSRIYSFVRLLFPALPAEDRPSYLYTSSDLNESDHERTVVVSANTLLLPVLLPRLYPPLFTLYVLYNQKLDDLYWDRLQKWNRQSDLALMNFLGVDPKFFIEIENANGSHFSGAVDCLQQLSTTFSPGDKLNVIHQTFQEVSRVVQTHLGNGYVLNMDDLFPLFLFVVVRARIRHLGTEIHLMDDLIDKNIQNGELDVMFTTLEASYKYIQHEKMTFT